ncbi:MAG: hypothetical protein ACI4VN_04745 [Clostridia bacterium]|nr:hypothetical protein [Clostridia bacterium]
MNLTKYDHRDVTNGTLAQISEADAREFIKENVEIILRTSNRDFYRVNNLHDFEQAKRLREMGVYNYFQTYLD